MHLSSHRDRRLPARSTVLTGARLVLATTLALIVAAPALAVTAPATTLSITTPYPSVSLSPGTDASFQLTVASDQPTRVDLALAGVPDGWDVKLTGGGNQVSAVTTSAKADTPTTVRLDVNVPAGAAASSYRITVTATAGSLSAELPIDIIVSAEAGGQVTLRTDFPSLRGAASGTFTFNLTLRNETAQDLTFGVNAQGDPGWTVTARPASQTQASAFQVNAGSSTGITVTADPPSNVAAGVYPITVTATAGERSVGGQLQVEITGSFSLEITTPDGRLNANGPAGGTISRTLVVRNTGTGDLANVAFSQTLPADWKVAYDPPGPIETLAAGQELQVTAVMTPANNAIAGDYVATFRATAGGTATVDSTDIRVTIETPLNWLVVGGGIIVLVLIGLSFVFTRYGRR